MNDVILETSESIATSEDTYQCIQKDLDFIRHCAEKLAKSNDPVDKELFDELYLEISQIAMKWKERFPKYIPTLTSQIDTNTHGKDDKVRAGFPSKKRRRVVKQVRPNYSDIDEDNI
ncbi:hypothetical protein GCK72_009146 [Caenorhabditis remanei]|uniref:Uncharacterized protein n=1 Tax=Caenorhabditis remanei TaxID=31234 RepID=A0A6A5H285_CAERE|nr:hypothetical protein GCK72_009146 [Caenorhabditis remanei]KAF1760894.1 hypothetical protein GCK72_009146 [Caenorhabditis remanei]